MSGSDDRVWVDLAAPAMAAVIAAIPEVESRTGRPVIVVGGLAVICRLGSAYRATTDLDTVNRRRGDEPAMLELLVNRPGARASGPAGALVPTTAGLVQVDVLEVTDADLAPLPDDWTDRLHVLSHAWAARSATVLGVRSGRVEVEVLVADSGPLVAMKLQAVMNRPTAKEATDLLDIVRLTLDPVTGLAVRAQLGGAPAQLRADAAHHVQRWFVRYADRSTRLLRSLPQGRDMDRDMVSLVAELLNGALSERG